MTDKFEVGDRIRTLRPDAGVHCGEEGVVREVGGTLVWVYFPEKCREDAKHQWYPYYIGNERGRYMATEYLEKLPEPNLWSELELM